MEFKSWLKRQANRNDMVGDLARDARDDSGFLQDGSLEEYRTYLETKDACDGAKEALNEAYKEYQNTNGFPNRVRVGMRLLESSGR